MSGREERKSFPERDRDLKRAKNDDKNGSIDGDVGHEPLTEVAETRMLDLDRQW